MREALVTVPTYVRSDQDLEMVERMLSSLRRFDPEVAVLVVDDASPAAQLVDGLRELTLRFNADFEARAENSGFSSTVNVGIRAAIEQQRDVILANADLEFRAPFADLMLGQQRLDGKGPAEVVGALLVYPEPRGLIQHAGQFMSILTRTFGHRYQYAPEDLPEAQEAVTVPVTGALQLIRLEVLESLGPFDEAFCSPGDETVLTSGEGYVPLEQLDPQVHGLVTVDHSAAGGRIYRGHRTTRWRMAGGYGFGVQAVPFAGQLRVIHAGDACTRVTPGHRLRVRWTERALASQAVYLMRRGRDWRIGVANMSTSQRAFGPRVRQVCEGADAVWILALCDDRLCAELLEAAWSVDYGLPQTLFRAREDKGPGRRQAMLDEFWRGRNTEQGARALLAERGLNPRYPLLGVQRSKGYVGGAYHGFLVHAANLMTGYMYAGIDPGTGMTQRRELLAVEAEPFSGTVYALEVPPYRYYVSGGVVVHNSLGHEDVDYNVRVLADGGECVMQPLIRAWHHESAFRGQQDEKIARWHRESWAHFKEKWAGENFLRWIPSF